MSDRMRIENRWPTFPPMVFLFLAFFLLGLKDFFWLSFVMALAAPMVFFVITAGLPRILPADRLLLCLVNFLCALGVLVLYRLNPDKGIAQAVNYLVGLTGMVFCILLVRFWRQLKWSVPLIAVFGVLLMALPVFFGVEIKGARAWVTILGLSFQPSEIVKVILLLLLSFFLSRRRVILAIGFAGVCLFLLMLQEDLGTALLYYLITMVLIFSATGSLSFLSLGAVGAVGAAVVGYNMFSHVKRRVAIWINPWLDYQGAGYQIVQSLVAMANGGLWGTGLGLGNALVIPEVENDFIFSAIMNEFGVLFGVCVILLYVLIFLRGIAIASRSRSRFHTLLALGCSCLIALQTFVIIGGNIKLIPLTGVTLPFVSFGGTSLVSSLAIMGLLQGVASVNEENIKEDQMIALLGEDV